MTNSDTGWFTHTEVFLLHEIVTGLDRLARTVSLNRHGLSYTEFVVAMAVRELSAPSHSDVADFLDLSNSSVSQRIASLRKKQMVVQRRDPESRRVVRLALTAHGSSVLEEVYGELVHHSTMIFDQLKDRPEFRESLLQVREGLRNVEPSDRCPPRAQLMSGPEASPRPSP